MPGGENGRGDIVLLEDQDLRTLWDYRQIAEGVRLVEEALRMPGRPQSYAVQAAIAALHARAPNYKVTDWPQIAGLYDVLLRISPSPVIELNHAAAVSMVDGPARALDLIDTLEARGGLKGYELLPAVRADLLRRLRQRRRRARRIWRRVRRRSPSRCGGSTRGGWRSLDRDRPRPLAVPAHHAPVLQAKSESRMSGTSPAHDGMSSFKPHYFAATSPSPLPASSPAARAAWSWSNDRRRR